MTIPASFFGRKSALLALGTASLTVVVLLAFTLFVIVGSANEEADENHADLARFRAETAARPYVEKALAALRAQAANLPSFAHGDSDALAEARLQSDVKAMVEHSGGEVRSAFALPPSHEHGLARLSVQYDITVPATHLHELAYAVEAHLPALFIMQSDITAPQTWPTDPKAPEPLLELRWTVSAYRSSGAP
jgi:hypothetical protein